jgi:hypothetical protein
MALADKYHKALRQQFARALELVEPDLLQPDDPAKALVERLRANRVALHRAVAETVAGQELRERLPTALRMPERDLNRALLRLQTHLAAATHAQTVLLRLQLEERLRR